MHSYIYFMVQSMVNLKQNNIFCIYYVFSIKNVVLLVVLYSVIIK